MVWPLLPALGMETITPNETVVMEGTFLYDGKVECDIRIVRSAVRFGSGDYEDPPEIASDNEKTTFYIQFGSTTQRDIFNAGGKACDTLEEAMSDAKNAPGIGSSIRWR